MPAAPAAAAPEGAEAADGAAGENPTKRQKVEPAAADVAAAAPPAAAAAAAVVAAELSQRAAPADATGAAGARFRQGEVTPFDFTGKLYLAPLTTTGNLPFRRICKGLGADVTVCEMAMATNLLQGQASEWALLRRHPSEDNFGIQVCGGYPDALARCAELLEENVGASFVDVNMGCPIDVVCSKGAGSALLTKPGKMEQIARAMSPVLSVPLTLKTRMARSAPPPPPAPAVLHSRPAGRRPDRLNQCIDGQFRKCSRRDAECFAIVRFAILVSAGVHGQRSGDAHARTEHAQLGGHGADRPRQDPPATIHVRATRCPSVRYAPRWFLSPAAISCPSTPLSGGLLSFSTLQLSFGSLIYPCDPLLPHHLPPPRTATGAQRTGTTSIRWRTRLRGSRSSATAMSSRSRCGL